MGPGTWLGRMGQSLSVLPSLPLASPRLVAFQLRPLRRLHRLGWVVAAPLVRPLPLSVELVRR